MKHIYSLLLIFVVVGCQRKEAPAPGELYEKYRPSVVLIKNEYLYKATLDNNLKIYFIPEGDEITLFTDEEEALQNAAISYGTGFIINDAGQIATNRHVVYPEVSPKIVWREISSYLDGLAEKISLDLEKNQTEIEEIIKFYNTNYNELSPSEATSLRKKHDELKIEISELNDFLSLTEFSWKNSTIEVVDISLGIAYDNTFVDVRDDFEGCVRIKKSESTDIDLAIIQLKSKRTPSHIINYFNLEQVGVVQKLKMDDEVYMIGYNEGIGLANTEEGIKSQFTKGNVSQDPSAKRIMYTVPTLPGSSGSPVMDKWGNLVAINYAKTFNYQGFSFGVPVDNLIALQNNKIPEVIKEAQKNQIAEIKNDEELFPNTVAKPKKVKTYYYNILPSSSILHWSGSKPTGEHNGVISIREGSFALKNGNIVGGNVMIDMRSLEVIDDMGENLVTNLENHLKGTVEGKEGDFFNVNHYPTAEFNIIKVNQRNGKNYLFGNLTMKGTSNQIEFPVTININMDETILEVVSEVIQLDRTRWGINYGSKSIFSGLGDHFISDDIKIRFDVKSKIHQSL